MSHLRRPSSADRESGQLPTALILLVFFGMLIVIFGVILPIGEATDQKAGSQAAADAAALAAAKQIGEDLPGAIADAVDAARTQDDLLDLLAGFAGGFGRESAVDFADRNGSNVTAYNYSRFADEIDVSVQERRTAETGDRAVSRAKAALGLRLGPCNLIDDPVVTPSPTPPPTGGGPLPPPPPPPPPVDIGVTLQCGDLELHFILDGATGRPTLDTPLDDLEDRVEPKLIG